MTGGQRAALDFASRILAYPDEAFFAEMPELRREAIAFCGSEAKFLAALNVFLEELLKKGPDAAREEYVAAFDHSSGASLYMAWHRYGNDRGQGKALAALNGLYRAAGFEPEYGSLPDYLPRMLEFMANADEWAVKTLLDGFGPEIARVAEALEKSRSPWCGPLAAALAPLRKEWPDLFAQREEADSASRPMSRRRLEELSLGASKGERIIPMEDNL